MAAALVAAAAACAAWLLGARQKREPAPQSGLGRVEELVARAVGEIRAGRLREAREILGEGLRISPEATGLHFLMGQCLRQMSCFEASIPHWKAVYERDPMGREEARFSLGIGLSRMGRAAEAIKYLDGPFEAQALEWGRQMALAECYLELELYEEALRLVEGCPSSGGVVRTRHRALCYLGRPEEARRAVEGFEGNSPEDRLLRSVLLASQAREEGDFDAAGKMLESASAWVETGSSDWAKLKRSEIALRIESGEVEGLEAVAGELARGPDAHVAGVALWGRVIGMLMGDRREEAGRAARDFLSRVDPEFTPLRLERLMMLHLVGEVGDEALEDELRSLPRSWQNDLLYYLALARGGDRGTAERALKATPGRNFPYHAIRRLVKG